MLTIRVEDLLGTPLPGATVTSFDPSDQSWEAPAVTDPGAYLRGRVEPSGGVTDASGIVRLGSVDASALTLRVELAATLTTEWLPYLDPAWTPRDTVVRMAPSLSIEGRVEDAHGVAVTEGQVEARIVGAEPWNVRVEYDGTFEIRHIPPGSVSLRFFDEDAPATASSPVTATEAGAKDVVVRAHFGAELVVRVANWPREAGGTASLTPEPRSGAPASPAQAEISLDGVARFRGLVAGAKYALWIPPSIAALRRPAQALPEDRGDRPPGDPAPTSDEAARVAWCAYVPEVKPGAETLLVTLRPGRTLTAKLALPTLTPGRRTREGDDGPFWDGVARIRERGVELDGFVEPTGAVRIEGVPEGSWLLSVRMESAVASNDVEEWMAIAWWAGEGVLTGEGGPPTIGLRSIPVRPDHALGDD